MDNENFSLIRNKAETLGLIAKNIPDGIMIFNGEENFVFYVKKGTVPRLYHQNYFNKGQRFWMNKFLNNECKNFSREDLHRNFHKQDSFDIHNASVDETLAYIKNHANAYRRHKKQNSLVLQAIANGATTFFYNTNRRDFVYE